MSRRTLFQPRQLGRFWPVPDGAAQRDAVEWSAGAGAAKQQTPATHVTTPGERGGEVEPLAKHGEQRSNVLVGRAAVREARRQGIGLAVEQHPRPRAGAVCGREKIDGLHFYKIRKTCQACQRDELMTTGAWSLVPTSDCTTQLEALAAIPGEAST